MILPILVNFVPIWTLRTGMFLIILSCNQKPIFMKLRLFICFLNTHGLYEEYFSEVRRSLGPSFTKRDIRNYLSRLSPDLYIISPIKWCRTFRGSNFWFMVDNTWLDCLKCNATKN